MSENTEGSDPNATSHTECGVCHKFYTDWVQLVGQPVRCIHCLANALEAEQRGKPPTGDQLRLRQVEALERIAEVLEHMPGLPDWFVKR